jgi:hypothetical protein
MAKHVESINTCEPLDAGTSAALRINRRIENDEIPLFMRRCIIDATRWEVDGTRYDEWRSENGNAKIPAAEWREQVVIPHLQERFDGLEVRDDDRIYGIRHDTAEEINEQFYNPQQLRGAMLAKCPGQRWLFALGCCRRNRPPQ